MSRSSYQAESSPDPLFDDPIGMIEEYAIHNNLQLDRTGDNEVMGEFPGQWSNYRLWVVYHEETGFLQYNCYMDVRIPDRSSAAIAELMTLVNERIWLGHFEIWGEEQVPLFRVVQPLRGSRLVPEQVEDIMTSLFHEVERFYPAVQWVVWGGKSPKEAISAAIMETDGEA